MLKAIHKETGKLISAYKIARDPLWMGKERVSDSATWAILGTSKVTYIGW